MRKRLWFFLWIAGVLFPMAWLGRFSSTFKRVFDAIFGPLWVHIFMHTLLYTVLVILLFLMLKPLPVLQSLALALGAVLLVGLLQEGFQSLSTGAFTLPGSAFDLGVDLMGGALGVIFFEATDSMRRNPGRTAHRGKKGSL